MLEADSVTVRYGGRLAVDGVSLRIDRGTCVALCGPNGAGKSTLLAALAGEHPLGPDQVRVDGESISGMAPASLALKRAVLEQSPSLTAAFSVTELISLSIPLAVSPTHTAQIVASALEAVDLAAFGDRHVSSLSGGQRHRAHLGRALAQLLGAQHLGELGCLMLDEPTASLDIAHQIAVMRLCKHIAQEGGTVVVVLHDLNLAAAFADAVALMHAGKLVSFGPPAKVFTEARLEDVYGTPVSVTYDPSGRPTILPHYTSEKETLNVHRHEPVQSAAL
ncbi:MAG: heme ABC transporter ATP-binding protein [Pseudomonadota bacterium]